ncbi:MAG: hypothetical protein WBN88_02000, partial [Anderseniella sp.]
MLKRTIILLAIVSACLFGQGALAQQASDPSFECLSGPGPLEVTSGFYDAKFKPVVTPGKRFDARGANFELPGTLSHALVALRGSGDNNSMCWAGGYFTTSLIWHGLDVSWDQSKHGTDGDGGVMNNTTSVTSFEDRMTWTGLHVFNMHDGIRTSNSESNWTIQHSWLDYIRDDCVENDHIYSGKIYDSLFDGCYTGISVRPSSSGHGDSQGKTITMDRVLLRMEPMPYPYKWDTKNDPLLYVEGYGDVPFGYGKVFKLDKGNVPDFRITNSVFLLEYDAGKTIFPPKARVSVCNNNTVIWLGEPGDAPNYLLDDFPGCFTVITDRDQGKSLWKRSVADWHAKHPGVGANRKPALPGDYSWPRYTPEGSTPPHNSAFVRQRRAMEADETGLSNPAGLAFSSRADAFHVLEGREQGQPPPAQTDIIKLTFFADRVGSARIAAAIKNPINMAFDNKANRLLIFQSVPNKLIEVLERPDGNLGPTTLISHDARHIGLQNPQGMTVDPASGHLLILDNAALQIVRIAPEPDGSFDNDGISLVDLQPTGLIDVRGLALDPATGNLHVVNPAEQKLYELTQTGKIVTTRDLSEFELGDPQGMVFAPSGDQTDDPLQM